MIKRMLVILFCLCFCLCSCNRAENNRPEPDEVSSEVFAMNTYITMTAYDNNADTVLDSAEKWIREMESLWSVTDEESELHQVNHNVGNSVSVSESALDLNSAAEMKNTK